MLIQTWGQVFSSSLQSVWLGFANFVPNLIIAIVVFIIGWVLGSVISRAIAQVVSALKIDKLFQGAGAEEVLNRAGIKLNVGGFIGWIIKWFIIVVFLMTSLEVLGLQQVNSFLREVVLAYLPQVVIAALILILATVVADFIRKVVSGAAKAANVKGANMVASISYYAIWIFALIIALSTLGIAPQFMQILFTGIVAMLAIAGGLAFGLGGRDAAQKSIENLSEGMK